MIFGERALARAVLAHERVHFAGLQFESRLRGERKRRRNVC